MREAKTNKPGTEAKDASERRRARLARELRANLLKRKQQRRRPSSATTACDDPGQARDEGIN